MIATLVEDSVRDEIIYPHLDKLIKTQPVLYVEIGVFIGGNISRVADRYKNDPVSIYGIDTFEFVNISNESFQWANTDKNGNYLEIATNNLKDYKNIQLHVSDSYDGIHKFEQKSIDCLFIDGLHADEKYHTKELEIWLPYVKDGGMICGHDWPLDSIKNAVYKIFKGKHVFGCSSNGGYGVIV